MFTLPEVPGKYSVGATTFAVHIPPPSNQECEGHVIGSAKLKTSRPGAPDGPALVMKEIAFTAYYPAEIAVDSAFGANLQKGMHWLSRPVKQSLKGYAYFGQISFWLVYCLLGGLARLFKIPVYPNTPLLDPKSRKEGFNNAWPLVIFSHGLGGTRTNYSHVCSRLASEGRVVLAIEHRDGTGPFVMRRSPTPGLKEGFRQEPLLYLDPDHDVCWEQGSSDQYPLRRDQLLFRRLEVYLTYTHFRNLVEANLSASLHQVAGRGVLHTIDGPWNFDLGNRPQDNHFWKSWTRDDEGSKPKIHADEINLVGHSFGGATVLSVVSEPVPTLEGHEFVPLSVQRTIALDPWLEPLPLPGPSPRNVQLSLTDSPVAPSKLLVMNSEGFTFWDDHFARLKEIVETWKKEHPGGDEDNARLLTLLRGTHVGFSDFSLLTPFGQQAKDARTFSDLIVKLSSAFLNGSFSAVLQKQSVKEEEIENLAPAKDGKQGKRRYTGSFGDLVVHI